MIQHAHSTDFCQCIQRKAPIIVLSDNYWLYFGVSQLYPYANVIHVSFLMRHFTENYGVMSAE